MKDVSNKRNGLNIIASTLLLQMALFKKVYPSGNFYIFLSVFSITNQP